MTTTSSTATSPADAEAVVAVERHHAELAGRMRDLVAEMLAGAGSDGFEDARRRAAEFLQGELVPHAAAEEKALYPAAAADPRGRLLVDGMLAEHRAVARLVEEVAHESDPVRAAAAGYALQVLFEVHLGKEDDLVLPLVAADPAVSLADILAGMHELLGGHADEAQ